MVQIVVMLFLLLPVLDGTDLRSFIPAECCVTHDCCFEIQATDVVDVGEDRYRVRATGEVLTISKRSPDGRFYRCACNYNFLTNQYVTDLKAKTRCLLAPIQGV